MKDVENAVISMSSGKPVTSTAQLSGEAKKTKAENASNSPTKYDTGPAAPHGALGGRNKRN